VSRYREGFATIADLVAPTVTQGAAQRLVAGSTSAAVTVGTASGGSGSFVYSAPIVDAPGGSSAAVSGTAPGALSVTGLADGEAVVVSGTVTDSASGQLVSWSHTVAVAASGGGGSATSELLQTWDFRTADAGTLSGSGTITTDSGGTNVVGYNVFVQTGSPTATTDVTAAGLRVNRSAGNSVSGIALALSGPLALCDDARDTLLVLVHFVTVANPAMVNNQNLNVAVSSSNSSISSTPTRGLFLNNTSASSLAVRVREYDGGATTVTERTYGSSWPTSGTALLEITASRVLAGWSDAADPARSAVTVAHAGADTGDTAPRSSPLASPYAHLLIAPNPQVGGSIDLTISHVEIFRLAAGAT
jgi:hypothetical protein